MFNQRLCMGGLFSLPRAFSSLRRQQRDNRIYRCILWGIVLAIVLLCVSPVKAHQVTFNSSMTYSDTQPTGGGDSVANWTGAAFDVANIGGSGVNADGGSDNGTANNDYTYVANDRPAQGQSFLTGSATNGYQLNTITVRMTMDLYTHLPSDQERASVNAFPELRKQRVVMRGTDSFCADAVGSVLIGDGMRHANITHPSAQTCQNRHKSAQLTSEVQNTEGAVKRNKTPFSVQNYKHGWVDDYRTAATILP